MNINIHVYGADAKKRHTEVYEVMMQRDWRSK